MYCISVWEFDEGFNAYVAHIGDTCALITPYGDIDLDHDWRRQGHVAWCTKPLLNHISEANNKDNI